jgi:hypothetical protein
MSTLCIGRGTWRTSLTVRNRLKPATSASRLFTNRSQLLLISRSPLRPQLPFLHNVRFGAGQPGAFQVQLARLLSTENRNVIKENIKLIIRYTIYLKIALGCYLSMGYLYQHSCWEKEYPAPPEFTELSKYRWRAAHGAEHPDEKFLVPWLDAGQQYKKLIARLEDPNKDGAGIRSLIGEGEDVYVEGVAQKGLDVSGKSEPWRRAYHEALMGAARAAEHLDTWVRDKKRNMAFAPEHVIGPSNPRPKPVQWGSPPPPKEEDCEVAFDPAELYYMKIMTTQGFSSRQKIDAALAYGDWLQYKGLISSSRDMYDWAWDIATKATDGNIVNKETKIINAGAKNVTSNILLVTTAIAEYEARAGNLANALPIFLSVLRAQQHLPPADASAMTSSTPSQSKDSPLMREIKFWIREPPYPPAPPSGDEPATRTPVTSCLEAANMARIGEILYVSSSSKHTQPQKDPTPEQSAGLSWTRDAVSLAEATIRSIAGVSPQQQSITELAAKRLRATASPMAEEVRTKCVDCLDMALVNWRKMVRRLRDQEIEANILASRFSDGKEGKGVSSWIPFWSSPSSPSAAGNGNGSKHGKKGPGLWAIEETTVAQREDEIRKLLKQEGLRLDSLE